MTYVFFNPLSNNKQGEKAFSEVQSLLKNEQCISLNTLEIPDMKAQLTEPEANDRIVICGGDGTLHHFVNDIYDSFGGPEFIKAELLYYPSGSGNDFMHDVAGKNQKRLIQLRPYITGLPSVTINKEVRHFINGIGVGLDGWCCSEVERIRSKKGDKPINYTPIALRGLLYAYKPVSATVITDGVRHRYSGVWIAPTMNGRYFGGGMKVAPNQDRLNEEKTVSFIAAHSISRLRAFPIFPEFLSGKYIRHTKYVDVIKAKEITVTFDEPLTLQIDGEAIANVSSYHVKCAD